MTTKVSPQCPQDITPIPVSLGITTGKVIANRPHVPPPIDPTMVSKEAYIPMEFAHNKIVEVASDMQMLKSAYEKYVDKLRDYYDKIQSDIQTHYETYIMDLKKTALKHIEYTKNTNKKREQDLLEEIAKKEEEMDDLRDVNASRVSEYQGVIHGLKDQIHLKEQAFRSDQAMRGECESALREILREVEEREMRRLMSSLSDKLTASLQEKDAQYSQIKQQHEEVETRLLLEQHRIQEDFKVNDLTRRECHKALLSALSRVEEGHYASIEFEHSAALTRLEEDASNSAKYHSQREKLMEDEIEGYRNKLADVLSNSEGSIASLREELERKLATVESEKEAERAILLKEKEKKAEENDALSEQMTHGEVRSVLYGVVAGVELKDSVFQVKRLEKALRKELQAKGELQKTIDGLKEEMSTMLEGHAKALAEAAEATNAVHTIQAAPVSHNVTDDNSKSQLCRELEDLKEQLILRKRDLEAAVDMDAQNTATKVHTKNIIKSWMKEFEKENGRVPTTEEKSQVKDKFIAHKQASAAAAASAAEVERVTAEVSAIEKSISDLQDKLDTSTSSASELKVPLDHEHQQVQDGKGDQNQHSTEADAATGELASSTIVEDLKATISQLEADNVATREANAALEADKSRLSVLLDSIRHEKRTDVIARLEGESDDLRKENETLQDTISSMKTERIKMETKMKELAERVEEAEAELKERDERDTKQASVDEELIAVKTQVSKQRNQIVMKSKAATAGWDAAADAEEKLEIEIERSYNKGLAEGKKIVNIDMKSLNEAIEVKEKRITELIEQCAEAERRASGLAEELEKEKQRPAAVVSADRGASSSQGEKGGSVAVDSGYVGEAEDVNYELEGELERAKDSLDEAQEEIVTLSEQIEDLKSSLEFAEKKIAILEQIVESSGDKQGATAIHLPGNSLDSVLDQMRSAIERGTKLWNDKQRDACFDLYNQVATKVVSQLCTPELRDPLGEAIASANGQNKKRGAVILRKAFDQLMIAGEDPVRRQAEEAVSGSSATSKASAVSHCPNGATSDSGAVDRLKQQLTSLKAAAPATTAAASATATGEGGNALLLKRAKAAEEKVEELKKRLTMAGGTSGKGGGRTSAGTGGADPTEIKKLQKRIRELESQGGGGNSATDKKALVAAEKKFEKQSKEVEKVHRKEKAALEGRVSVLEKDLERTTSALTDAESERDQLRQRVKELGSANSEMEALRLKADSADQLAADLQVSHDHITQLTAQYKKEANLRKKYKNELEDLKGAIRVYARVRPMAQYEKDRNCECVVSFPDETSVKVQTSRGEKEFEFDAAFTDTSTQEQVFEDTKRLVESMLDGYNVCLFAYGQTGSGKTFTMTGSADLPGLTPRSINEMYRLIHERTHCTVRVSTYFVELYNDNIVDLYWLLDNKKGRGEPPRLDIKLDSKKMVYIKNCIVKDASSAEELMELFRLGNMERHVGATKMNAESSRSHSIFAVMCESYDSTTKKTVTGKLSLVDLAGSERADKTGASAERLREAQSINKSLSALGDVISALSEGEKFIPYRNNKLTQLMQDSLGGNAKTLMFVNFSPADYNSDETVTSLSYATRVKKITNNASKQAESEEVARLKALIKKLQQGIRIEEDDEGGDDEHK
mmetsp:Transcript_16795/g.25247  ORF Transcript_16795/g.25247 Transcript_16795/m.25247 type:complete len:1631 (-) Transcript_16795:170-5062(-)|eukprot:CAMPEP_0185021462 /NCGR_PEP_ID=MMETSP1103-20130426/4135_1 /TAXON_ID=36769 /ORGANISM="Paraphysomonas bandaiensis, Strain Caron Lab Isolate" /LENGTH=1630 /DNA_ID=CAMNT_0027552987 /DNA_START=104 /DNA_END=4996 /DNA_ORIENTATION=+